MEVIEVKGGVAILLPEHFCDSSVLELGTVDDPLVTKPSHILNAFLTLLLEQYGGGGLGQGVQCRCTVWTSVVAAPAKCQMKLEPELTTTLAEPSCNWSSRPF